MFHTHTHTREKNTTIKCSAISGCKESTCHLNMKKITCVNMFCCVYFWQTKNVFKHVHLKDELVPDPLPTPFSSVTILSRHSTFVCVEAQPPWAPVGLPGFSAHRNQTAIGESTAISLGVSGAVGWPGHWASTCWSKDQSEGWIPFQLTATVKIQHFQLGPVMDFYECSEVTNCSLFLDLSGVFTRSFQM